MKRNFLILLGLIPLAAFSNPFTLQNGDLSFAFDGQSKAILQTASTKISIDSLWMLTFHDHPSVNASSFLKESWNGTVQSFAKGRTAIIAYRSDQLDLNVTVTLQNKKLLNYRLYLYQL